MDIMVGATIDNIMMVERRNEEKVSEAEMLEAIKFALKTIKITMSGSNGN